MEEMDYLDLLDLLNLLDLLVLQDQLMDHPDLKGIPVQQDLLDHWDPEGERDLKVKKVLQVHRVEDRPTSSGATVLVLVMSQEQKWSILALLVDPTPDMLEGDPIISVCPKTLNTNQVFHTDHK